MDLLTRAMAIVVVILILTGLGAYSYSPKTKLFDSFPITIFYAIIVITAFCVVYLQDIYSEISARKFDLANVGKFYFHMNILASIVSYLSHTFNTKRQINFINIAKERLYEIILYLDDGQMYREQVIKVGVKAIIYPLLLEIILLVRGIYLDPDRNLLWTLYTLTPYMIRTIPTTSIYGGLLLGAAFIESINLRLEVIMNEINQMHTHREWLLKTSFHRMQRCCDLSDEIDVLNEKYTTIIDISNELLGFSSIPWICSLLCNLVGIMLGCFTQYKSIAETIFNGKEYDIFNVLTDSAFMFISFMEIYSQSEICSEMIEKVRRTGNILETAKCLQADIRLRKSIEFFSLRILQRNYKIKPLGLFEVDLSLIHGVFSTAAGFLLILIQSDLSSRFLQ